MAKIIGFRPKTKKTTSKRLNPLRIIGSFVFLISVSTACIPILLVLFCVYPFLTPAAKNVLSGTVKLVNEHLIFMIRDIESGESK